MHHSTSYTCITQLDELNTLRPRQNDRHFANVSAFDISHSKLTCPTCKIWHLSKQFLNLEKIFSQIHLLNLQFTFPGPSGYRLSVESCVFSWKCSWFDSSCASLVFNTLRPRQNGRHFADDTFKRIFFNKNVRILAKISLKFVPKGPINNNPSLVQIMAWRRSGDKPLSEPMMVSLLTHICVAWPQWVKGAVDHKTSLVQVMAWYRTDGY